MFILKFVVFFVVLSTAYSSPSRRNAKLGIFARQENAVEGASSSPEATTIGYTYQAPTSKGSGYSYPKPTNGYGPPEEETEDPSGENESATENSDAEVTTSSLRKLQFRRKNSKISNSRHIEANAARLVEPDFPQQDKPLLFIQYPLQHEYFYIFK